MDDSSTNTSTQDGNNTSGSTSDAGDGFKPIMSQDDLNRIIADRVSRERAKFADYKDLKAKADQFDQSQQANQSAEDRFNARIAELERQNAELARNTLRARIQAKFKIEDDDADLFLTGTDEATLTAQAQRLADRDADRKKNGNRAPTEGRTPPIPGADPVREYARNLFGAVTDS